MTVKKSAFAWFAVLAVGTFFGVRPAHAALVNGGFETGTLSGWNTIGDTSVVTSSFGSGPVIGTYEALVKGGAGGSTTSGLEAFLGVPGGSLNALGNGITHGGSAIGQTFTAAAGQTLTFRWNFITDEQPPSVFNDFAFYSLSSLSTLADANQAGLTPFGSLLQTRFSQTSLVLPATGTYSIALGVANVSDAGGLPQLLVDDVTLSTPVPEPGYGLGVALVLAAAVGRSRWISRSRSVR